MKSFPWRWMVSVIAFTTLTSQAVVRYVNVSNPAPLSPYTNWATAATSIQQAIDVSSAGDQILVTNGVYQTGGQTVYGSVLNRVALIKPVIVQSVNGAAVTTIVGYTGGASTRCAYLTNGAALIGFTLTNGLTGWDAGFANSAAGGVWGETNSFVSNCVIINNTAEYAGGVLRATLTNCIITGNTAQFPGAGGGASASVLFNCMIISNSAGVDGGGADNCVLTACVLSGNGAIFGGGARESTLHFCTVTNNSASQGGGVITSSANNCTINNNSAAWGGGAAGGTLANCRLSGNSSGEGVGANGATLVGCTVSGNAAGTGGGAISSTLLSCAIFGNAAPTGGGVSASRLTNCTLTGNAATSEGGGAYSSTLANCIAFYNVAPLGSNYSGSTLTNCCTAPLPVGANNIAAEPLLADFAHLSALSPCRGAGNFTLASGSDFDGEVWLNPPSMGCDEFNPSSITGALTVAVQATYTNVATQFTVDFLGGISGHAGASRWTFGDGTVLSNRPYASHSWLAAGNYPVTLTAYNVSNPGGISATVMVSVLQQPVHYVALNSTNPVPPYFSWATAAGDIQSAVDVAYAGGTVLVSNGVYQTGGRVIYGALTNRLTITRPITVKSANGPAVTVIQGNPTNGDSAIRCAYLTNGASLSGFTLTQGGTRTDGDVARERSGGGVWCENNGVVVSNCVVSGNSANYFGGGAYNGTLVDCVLSANFAYVGGAASAATLNNSVLATNTAAGPGGGAQGCTLSACTLAGNRCGDYGGGADSSTLVNCLLRANWSAYSAAGANNSTLNRCVLTGNSASGFGGGARNCTMNSCVLIANSAQESGGGADAATLNNCTLTGNYAPSGGGAVSCALNNCIIYYNHGTWGENYFGDSTLMFCCTTPLPVAGLGNVDAEPLLVSASHLSAASPCRAAGNYAFATGTDIDGDAWLNAPSIGCDEFNSGSLTGTLSVAILANCTNVAAGFAVDFAALITGAASGSRWNFGDGTVVSNRPYAPHSWAAAGNYPVVLTAYNASNPGGISATVMVEVVSTPVHYVSLSSTNPVPPFASWSTAATNIQDAVDAATVTGALVLATNGTYQTGERTVNSSSSNRVAVTKPIVVKSVNGPALTAIQGNPASGESAVRCVYLTNGAMLSGFTLTQGATWVSGSSERMVFGGGVWCESASAVVSNCIITGNSANIGGGGAMGGTLYNCVLSTNVAYGEGAGANYSVLNNCVLSGNYGPDWWGGGGGGAHVSTLNNCTLAGNSGYYGGGANSCQLTGCTLTNNSTLTEGGGANACVLSRCNVLGNNAWSGGGAAGSTVDRSILSRNSANFGAGASGSSLRNSVLFANTAKYSGGGADTCTVNNCTLTGNSSGSYGGGASSGTLNNSILFYNFAPSGSNYLNTTFTNSCTLPLPPGVGNIGADPLLADFAHINAGSPCRGGGSAAFISGADIDGETWLNPPSMGCDESVASAATGALSVAISARFTNVVVGLALDFVAQISGHVAASRWEFGDGTVVSNRPYAAHSWASVGDFAVVLRAYNDTFPAGVSATVTVHVVTQPVHYVAVSNATPVAPFISWATAATNIQDAVDAVTTAGALVLVSNRVYSGTARLVNNDVPHRLAIDKPITVQSVNGPAATIIQGQPYDGAWNAIRCAYLMGGASLFGFTLTNGAAQPSWSETFDENRIGGGVWCDSPTALVSNCVIVACSAGYAGGGAYGGTLNNCTFVNDSATRGGGAYSSALNQCVLRTNTAWWYGYGAGGGVANSTLNRCLLAYNGADFGGGADASRLNNCTIAANYAANGGAVNNSAATNSAMTANSAGNTGGGANASALVNCTLTGNSATNSGGGVADCTNVNSLVFYNVAPAGSNWINSRFNFSCTLPLPPGGLGNFSTEPALADSFHLSVVSPCRACGLFSYTSGNDIDGEAWLNPPSVGCDEYYSGGIIGPLSVSIMTPYTNVAAGFSLSLQALITGHASISRWDFGDGTMVSNRPYASHAWAGPGDYVVEARVLNAEFPAGVSANITVHVQSPIHYVALGNPTPVSPYTSWATAATNIQDAVDSSFVGGTIIVSNGIYQIGTRIAGGSSSNRVAVTKPMKLQSANGPAVTVIQGVKPSGAAAVRCVSLGRDSALMGFTLSDGGTRNDGDGDLDQSGAGVWCESMSVAISNCVFTGNSAAYLGGGVMRGTLTDCTFTGNGASAGGGGAVSAFLNNCVLSGNSSQSGGGAHACTLYNCLLTNNAAGFGGGGGGGANESTLNNCVIANNSGGGRGGGAKDSLLNNCFLTGNYVSSEGGGAMTSSLTNCVLTGNTSSELGGGAGECTLVNCTLVANSSGADYSTVLNSISYFNSGGNHYASTLSFCSTTPLPEASGNFTNAPLFVNQAGGNFRLQSNSPCVNAGNNAYVTSSTDLDGNARVVGGTVDVGAYEFQGSGSVISYAWLQQFGLPTDGSADFADPDGDGMNNWQEWRADTVPTNSMSVLQLTGVANSVSGLQVSWQSVATRNYFLQRSTNLSGVPALSTIATNIPGQLGTTTYTDSTAVGGGQFFYRVGVEP